MYTVINAKPIMLMVYPNLELIVSGANSYTPCRTVAEGENKAHEEQRKIDVVEAHVEDAKAFAVLVHRALDRQQAGRREECTHSKNILGLVEVFTGTHKGNVVVPERKPGKNGIDNLWLSDTSSKISYGRSTRCGGRTFVQTNATSGTGSQSGRWSEWQRRRNR